MIPWTDDTVNIAFRQVEDAFRRAFLTPYWDALPTLAKATVIAEVLDECLTPELRNLAGEILEAVFAHTADSIGEPRARDRVVFGGSHARVFLNTGRRRSTGGEVTP